MKLNRFLEDRQERWTNLERLVAMAGKRPEKLDVADIRSLAAGYRSAAADLAIARRRFPGDPIVGRLERLTTTARSLVYERESRRRSLLEFYSSGYWQLLSLRWPAIVISVALLLLPAVLGAVWGVIDPDAAAGVVPDPFLWVTEEESTDTGLGSLDLAGFSTAVMVNNIRVTLAAFALGITWGLGTAYVVLLNGLILGAVTGLALEAGNGEVLVAAIAAHGVLELSCIVVGAAAGLSLGWSLLHPGTRTRAEALRIEAAEAFKIAGGTAPWLVLAGLVEGYVSRVGLGPVPTSIVGVVIGLAFWGLVVWRGKLTPLGSRSSGSLRRNA